MKVLDLFSGIGGFSLGLERAGMKTVAFCEIEEYPRKVLAKHWPDIPIYEDIRNVTKERLESDGIFPDVICGGFPCQDISVAGNQKGITAERSGLWSEFCRIIGDVRPKYAIVENVTALISGESGQWFGRVLGDLAEVGYDCEWHCISASELGAHHHRDRVWIICYPQHAGWATAEIRESDQAGNGSNKKGSKPACKSQGSGNAEILADTESEQDWRIQQSEFQSNTRTSSERYTANSVQQRLQGSKKPRIFREGREGWHKLITRCFCGFPDISSVKPTICGGANGIPRRVDRLKGLGNAVVPQIPELIGWAIMEIENEG